MRPALLVRSHGAVLIAVLGSAVATTVIVLWSALSFAYRAHSLHVGLETAAALTGLFAMYLVVGRFHRRRRLDDLLLTLALGLLAYSNLFFAAIPAMLEDGHPNRAWDWAALTGRVLGAAALAAAALATSRRVRVFVDRRAYLFLPPALLLGAVLIVVLLAGDNLPTGIEPRVSPETSGRPLLIGHVAVHALQLVTTMLFACAAFGFSRRAAHERDEFIGWLAAASVLAAFANFNYFLFPSLYSEWVYTGDAFRLLFYVAVLAAAAREIGSYWQAVASAAALDERRRIARDLHDGLAQELAFVRRNLSRLDGDDPVVARSRAGVARALSEARRAIAALTEPVDRPLADAVAEAAGEVAAREGIELELELARNVDVTLEQREALVRIACEAVANSARHATTDVVRLELLGGRRVSLRVLDDGSGFDLAAVERERRGFGLTGMRERAHAVGADFRVSSGPGEGTELEVVI